MTLQASGSYRTRKIRGAVLVSGTIDPPLSIGPVAHRQLKQIVAVPVQVSLSARTRPRHKPDCLRLRNRIGTVARDCCFGVSIAFRCHMKTQSWEPSGVSRRHNHQIVATRSEATQNRSFGRLLRGQMMRGMPVAGALRLVTGDAPGVSHKAVSCGSLPDGRLQHGTCACKQQQSRERILAQDLQGILILPEPAQRREHPNCKLHKRIPPGQPQVAIIISRFSEDVPRRIRDLLNRLCAIFGVDRMY